MMFLPYENIIYKTKLNHEEVKLRLQDNIEPEKLFRFGFFSNKAEKPYEGTIVDQYFRIKRIINYRNSFMPKIFGCIDVGQDGTIIKVKMKMNIIVTIFICLWCGIVAMISGNVLLEAINNSNFVIDQIPPFIMLALAYGMTIGGFKYESIKSKKYLQMLFEAVIIKD